MTHKQPHILLLEPYYGGSHRAFLKGLQKHLPFRFTLVSLPARKWKMRMQLAAPWMADEIIRHVQEGTEFDGMLCSSFIDLATLRVLLAQKGLRYPAAVYFHENQFAYPNQINDPARHQFMALNFTSAIAADTIAFNSDYNRQTFLEGVAGYLNKAADMDILHKVDELRKKSTVLFPGIDYNGFDNPRTQWEGKVPVVAWNHRWEHDKDPETFFATMNDLSKKGRNFKLIVLGQHFERYPDVFAQAEKTLAQHILHFGYIPARKKYIRLLSQADVVVSTAVHEFFGMAVLEAVRCGCRPLVPDRLAYRELFPARYRYAEGGFTDAMASLLNQPVRMEMNESLRLTDRFSWPSMGKKYGQWLVSLVNFGGNV